ncbi:MULTISPECIES: TniQ family protein [Nocardia]|uniref:TniQ family protein n=1 Tax=Nocardia TaxID=1817 RepID=UPI0024552561|nr:MULTISPECIES: TniQ family protein [Nocardia]
MTALLSQRPVTRLPFVVRPIGGEATLSYVFRLAAANEMTWPTTLVRVIGEPVTSGLDRTMVEEGFDAKLNAPARQRLSDLCGIPLPQLRRALPMPHLDDEEVEPRIAVTMVSSRLRPPCAVCHDRMPGRPVVRIYATRTPQVCYRHRRWLAADDQIDLTPAPDIVSAVRRRDKLRLSDEDRKWIDDRLNEACSIISDWSMMINDFWIQRLIRRWEARAAALGLGYGFGDRLLVTLPERVTLAETLADPRWRREVAVEDHIPFGFYQHVASRLGLDYDFGRSLSVWNNALTVWVQHHQDTHAATYGKTRPRRNPKSANRSERRLT